MSSYDEFSKNELVPAWVREVVTVGLAVSAIVLYGGILAAALYRTFTSNPPLITYGMERAAAVLGGLIGTVVTAGFARGRRTVAVQARGLRPVGAKPPSLWSRLGADTLLEGKMLGLARTVGLPVVSASLASLAADAGGASSGAPAETERSNKLAMWLAIVYFVVYLIAGLGAFGLTVIRETVPDMVSNAGWVWLGTMVSAGYAFFGVNPD
jgi:hypothetical protein